MKIDSEVGGLQMKGGFQNASIELISGLPPKSALKGENRETNILNEPFIFALNDQLLEESQISSSLILAAEINK